MAGRGLLSACLGGVVASFGCSALLDLDVEYASEVDAGSQVDADDAPNAADASQEASSDANGASTEAASGDDGDVQISPGVPDGSPPDGSPPDVSNEPPPAHPIQYVQSVASTNNDVGAIANVPPLTFTHPVTMGDTIIVAADGQTATLDAPTDSLGNTFSSVSSALNGDLGSIGYGSWIFYATVVHPGSDTIMVELPNNESGPLLNAYAIEYSGVGGLDAVHGQNGTTSVMHSGFVTTTVPGDMIFGYGVLYMGDTQAGTGFTPRATVQGNGNLTEDEIFPGPGNVEATGTMLTGNAWTMMVVALKAR